MLMDMKYLKINSLLIVCFLLLTFSSERSLTIKSSILEIRGYVVHKDKNIEKASIKLYQNNKIVQMMNTKKGGKFQFMLFSGMKYMVEINKPGFITERIQISTEEKTEFNGKYLYEFRVGLINSNKFKGVDISNLDFPTALIKYNISEGEYSHDAKYSKFVRAEMRKLQEKARIAKEKAR